MSELRTPLKQHLEDPAAEQEIQRTWRGIQQRRARSRAHREARTGLRLGVLAAAVALCAVLILRVGNPFAARAAGPLLVDGAAPSVVDGSRGSVLLSDGSRIELSKDARLEIADNSGQAFVSVLRSGRALFDVQPGGPRRWTIETGLVTVEVVGTRFRVTRSRASVEVAVEHGVVLVRGERVPERIRRLTAGQELRVTEPEEPVPARASSGQEARQDVTEASPASEQSPRAAASREAPPSSSAVPLGYDALLRRADAERRAGNLKAAIATLEAAVSSAPDRTHAAVAAFTLGKLLLDGAGRPAEAAHAFSRAVTLGPPAAIAEDALARLVEAEGRAGHRERARAAARKYAERYPNGPKLYAVNRWLEQR